METVLKNFTFEFFGKGKHKTSAAAFFQMEEAVLLDVRSNEEAASLPIGLGHHSNIETLAIPINEIPERLPEIPKDKPIGVFCPSNVRSAIVYTFLFTKGFKDVRIIDGGYAALTQECMPGKILQAVQAADYLKE
ncbi:MAG: rhodanese-like domain-containing protein [Desulfobacteraceae bacterium]